MSNLLTLSYIFVPVILLMTPHSVAGLLGANSNSRPSNDPLTHHVQKEPRGIGGFAVEGLKNGAASGLASASVKMLLQPLDVIKTVQQNSVERLSIVGAVNELISTRGTSALFSGFGVAVIGSVPSMAVYFGVYQFLKKQLVNLWGPKWHILAYAVSAALSNFIAAWFRVPAEILKVRLQANVYSSVLEGILDIHKRGGIGQFIETQSVMLQIIRDVPYAVFCLVAYELLRSAVMKSKTDDQSAKLKEENAPAEGQKKAQLGFSSMWIGAVSGGLASLLSNPMDVVKTRWMVAPDKYSGIGDVVMHLWNTEGTAAFFKGVIALP